ncbi:MAG: 30S ribosomal protein S19 [Candidatus Thermoplasmatota archaeon]|jgi:small subunit ribosomal protein S19|nr:30S ribosomal protein S19 [Candidatus Thermoplasmatota archaeon]
MTTNRQASAKSIRRRSRKSQKVALGRSKEFKFRGLTLEELQKLDNAELLKVLPSRARRSLKREMGPDQKILLRRLNRTTKELKTHIRDMVIVPKFVGRIVQVHNGKEYVKFEIKPEMIGHYLGEFAQTRKSVKHSGPGVGATRSSKFMPLK